MVQKLGTKAWNKIVDHNMETKSGGQLMARNYGTKTWNKIWNKTWKKNIEQKHGTKCHAWNKNAERKCGTNYQVRNKNMERKCGTKVWNKRNEQKWIDSSAARRQLVGKGN